MDSRTKLTDHKYLTQVFHSNINYKNDVNDIISYIKVSLDIISLNIENYIEINNLPRHSNLLNLRCKYKTEVIFQVYISIKKQKALTYQLTSFIIIT